jgi:excinuclease UvrABC nuclease subunit
MRFPGVTASLAEGEGKLPDLLLIDGGKGQLHMAVDVLTELGLGNLPMVGVAKGVERKPGMEQLFFPGEVEPLRLPPDHPGLHLIQQVRDEAHRFAITGHRAGAPRRAPSPACRTSPASAQNDVRSCCKPSAVCAA